jgi:hemerythrin-like metal-binding protein
MDGMFEWKQEYSIGIQSIDAQHQGLFAAASELYKAMSAGQGKSVVSRILDRLVQYTAMHFAHEERLMRQHAYADLENHMREHAALTRQVVEFQSEFRAGRVNISVQLLNFLNSWLQQHIKGSDKAYAPYLKAKAVA